MTARLGAALAATLSLLAATAHAAPPAPLVVPADETALAALVLAGAGTERPVVLFDPRDQSAFDYYARGRKKPFDCLHGSHTAKTTVAQLEAAAGTPCRNVTDLNALARELWPNATSAIATTSSDYPWLLRAAAFAGASGSALLMTDDAATLRAALEAWNLTSVELAPPAAAWLPELKEVGGNVRAVENPDALVAELLRRYEAEPPATIVVANPADRLGLFSPSSLSLLAPLVAARHRAPLFLAAGADPERVERDVTAWIDAHQLHPTHVLLVGDELGLGSHRVPDPVAQAGGPAAIGGGAEVRVELFSQIQNGLPQDYAVGRIVGEDAAVASTTLARAIHDRHGLGGKPPIFLSNADEVFALGETISRTTANELRNLGLQVKTYYRDAITPQVIRKSLEGTKLLVWEGHARDLALEEPGGVRADGAPDLVVLQGCYTLDRSDPFILLERGTQAIVATSAAIYSASGSAFARAFIDSILYDEADLGTAVRDARNYLLALVEMKKKRGHRDWRKTYRAALAFALWGDPTARFPLDSGKAAGKPQQRPVRWQRQDSHFDLHIPRGRLPRVEAGRYRAEPPPRAMLSGLILAEPGNPERVLKDLYFSVGPQASAATACPPGSGWDVVSLYAPRTQTLSILARPEWDHIDTPGDYGTFTVPLVAEGAACSSAATGEAPLTPTPHAQPPPGPTTKAQKTIPR
jgi:hypothetical protein